jgi:type IV pilus assembly protein PilA
MRKKIGGFTLIELMTVVAVIAILALIALPDMQNGIVRSQIVEAARLADVAKAPIAAAWAASAPLPADNAAAGLPMAELIVSNYVSAVQIEDGAIHMVFGNRAHGKIKGKTLTFRPAVVPGTNLVPVSWICGQSSAPNRMETRGRDRTDVPRQVLPMNCLGA